MAARPANPPIYKQKTLSPLHPPLSSLPPSRSFASSDTPLPSSLSQLLPHTNPPSTSSSVVIVIGGARRSYASHSLSPSIGASVRSCAPLWVWPQVARPPLPWSTSTVAPPPWTSSTSYTSAPSGSPSFSLGPRPAGILTSSTSYTAAPSVSPSFSLGPLPDGIYMPVGSAGISPIQAVIPADQSAPIATLADVTAVRVIVPSRHEKETLGLCLGCRFGPAARLGTKSPLGLIVSSRVGRAKSSYGRAAHLEIYSSALRYDKLIVVINQTKVMFGSHKSPA
jgi:hypothetical protein